MLFKNKPKIISVLFFLERNRFLINNSGVYYITSTCELYVSFFSANEISKVALHKQHM